MAQKEVRPVLIDFFALSGTGKSTHSKALADHLTSEGFRVKVLRYTIRRKKSSFGGMPAEPVSALFKSVGMSRAFLGISPRKSKVGDLFGMMKWCYRLLGYRDQIRSNHSGDLDYIILDPSLSSKLKKFYRYFDEDSFAKVISMLQEYGFMSDIVIILEADISLVKQRRLARGSRERVMGDSETFSILKAFGEVGRQNSHTNFLTLEYDCFTRLENNTQRIAELCVHTRAQLAAREAHAKQAL